MFVIEMVWGVGMQGTFDRENMYFHISAQEGFFRSVPLESSRWRPWDRLPARLLLVETLGRNRPQMKTSLRSHLQQSEDSSRIGFIHTFTSKKLFYFSTSSPGPKSVIQGDLDIFIQELF